MIIEIFLKRVFGDPVETTKFILELFLIYVIIRFRHKVKKPTIELPEKIRMKLIKDFKPSELLENPPGDFLVEKKYSKKFLNLASYDCFQIGNLLKDESKEIINSYGIGTCGPPTFYGTLDCHLSLQDKISEILGTGDSLLYSNSYTCVHSVISCFSTKSDYIFYPKNANEAIIRGINLSKSKCYEFDNLETLENLLKLYFNKKVNNFVIIEGLSKNEGEIINLKKILEFKEKYNFKIILDESLSIPFLDMRGVCGYFNVPSKLIEIRIGSFSYGFSSCGGFFTGDKLLTDYQRLNSSSYVFSASLPGVLSNFNRLVFDMKFDYLRIRRKIKIFHKNFKSEKYEIISNIKSPIILIRLKSEKSKKANLSIFHKIIEDLHGQNIYVGLNLNPMPTLMIGIKLEQKNVKKLAIKILEICEKY
ncbi:serine palmitoyltransferase 1 (LCB1) [Vairimorpha necatrix]|uniref:serine C-palmitoyltransferase n=1 Tax=Vairimorpha necatrix TaxID=6039 RepID=A0AAX4JA89_9MICR